MHCRQCGELIDENAVICVKCGTEKGKGTEYCAHCGSKVEKHQMACLNCGYAIPKEKISFKEFVRNKKKAFINAGIVALAIVAGLVAILIVTNTKKAIDFQKLYDDYCSVKWAEVADDGSYLYIDTNPYDVEGGGLYHIEAFDAVENVNKALGLPASLTKDISQTTWADGKQVKTYEDLGLEIYWRYHPDKGLEITYSKI